MDYREDNENNVEEQDGQENDNVVDDVDMTAPQPVQDEPQQPVAESNSDGAVVGRRNEDLPMENLSTPDAN